MIAPNSKVLFHILTALEDQPDPVKAAGCQILFGDIEIDVPAVSEHQLEVTLLHGIQLEQQHPAVTGRFFRLLADIFRDSIPVFGIAQALALGYQVALVEHTVLDHIGPTQQLGTVIRVL